MKLTWHFDFHTPAYVRVGEEPDYEGVARALSAARMDMVIFFAKCHFGLSYYPTEVGTRHPLLASDVFGGLLKASRAEGLEVAAYISFGIDGAGGEERPEWRRVYPDGSSDPSGWFINVCPFTSYLDERVLPQIEELHRLYRPDGFWFDTMSALSPCYCPQCRADYRRDVGGALPEKANDPEQARAGVWRHDRGLALVSRVSDFIRKLNPRAEVGFNQLGSLPYPEPMPAGVSVLTLDPDTSGPQTIPFSLNAAYGSNAPMPCEVMPTIFQGGWGDWSPASARRVETTALSCWMRGVTFIAGDRLHPEGHLTEISHEALDVVAAMHEIWDGCAPGTGATLAPDIVVLHSPSLTEGPDRSLFAVGDPRERLTPINGMHRLLLDAGFNFTVAGEWQLERALPGAAVLIVPEIPQIDASTQRRILAFAEAGGLVLLTGCLPLVNGEVFSHAGVSLAAELWQDHAYLPAWESGARDVLVRGPIREAVLGGAEKVLSWTAAYDARPGARYGWGIGPSSQVASEQPALTLLRHGGGQMAFLNAPIASDYARSGNLAQIRWVTRLIGNLAGEVGARVAEGAGGVELIVWQNGTSTWLYLLEHEGEQLVGEGRLWARRTRDPAPRTCLVRLQRLAASCELEVLQAANAHFTEVPGGIDIRCEFSAPFAALRVDWKD
jgi:Hypothetical glycosyl hydrolase 6